MILAQIALNILCRQRGTSEGVTYGSDGTVVAISGAAGREIRWPEPTLSDSEDGEESVNGVRTAEVQVHRPWGTYTR